MQRKLYISIIFFYFVSLYAFSQNTTTIQGIVKDSISLEPLAFVTIQFDNSTNGVFSDENGEFKLSNRNNNISVTASFIGYRNKSFTISAGKVTHQEILLAPEDLMLNEVVVRPHKEKYSKKDNPAVELIKKVIANKHKNNITAQKNYQCKEYERLFLAVNEFSPDMPLFKHYKFTANYVDSSIIDNKAILPFSIREQLSSVYYRSDPKTTRRIVDGYHIEGIDKVIETEGIDAVINEVFKDISIYDNSITLLFQNFVSPLSEHSSVNIYKWYINDTVVIDNKRYINMSFAPFNSRDIGFTGTLYITDDDTYAVKTAILKTPKVMNIKFVDEMVIRHEFKQNEAGIWVPHEQRMAIDLSMLEAFKFYVDKTQTYSDFNFEPPVDNVFETSSPTIFKDDYLKRTKEYWTENRPEDHQKDYKMDEFLDDVNNVAFLKILLKTVNIISSGYVATSKVPEKNYLELGTPMTFYSYNSTEGNRFRLTGATTKAMHPNLYLYGYGAYGTRDEKFKYYGEATWAFGDVDRHKEQFPKNNLTVGYKYDMNNLGQQFTQAERDNIMMSLRTANNEKLTYNREVHVAYEREYHSGFSYKISAQTLEESAAANFAFQKQDESGTIHNLKNIKTTEASVLLRYAPNEKFVQQRRRRFSMPAQRFITELRHTTALKDVLGGQYNYNKTSFSIVGDIWVAPYGKLALTAQADKLWGKAPFPHLISPSANNSFTIQKGSFYMINPIEFVHDTQASFEVYYYMGGWLLNRVPLIKHFKFREIFGIRGFYGKLSEKNNPMYNNDALLFPEGSFYTTGRRPYLEYNIGLDNIFSFFRVDYVRRINYLSHPGIKKHGFRVSFVMSF